MGLTKKGGGQEYAYSFVARMCITECMYGGAIPKYADATGNGRLSCNKQAVHMYILSAMYINAIA